MNWSLKMAPTNEENGDDGASSTPEYRDRLRTWLIKMIESGTIPGLHWENEEKTIFRMPWKHAGRQDYSLEEDSKIFMAWAIHSGRYREGIDKPEPIIWKTRLRCALNKMPDIKEIQERSRLDISEPYRVYQFLPPIHKDTQIRRRTQRRHSQVHSPTSLGQNSRDGSNTSPTYDRHDFIKEDITEMPLPRPTNFPGFMFQDPSPTSRRSGFHSDYSPRSSFEARGAFPWMNTPNFLPGLDRRLLHGLNLSQGLTSPINASSLMNPFGLFSHTQRDPRQRSEYDLPLYPYPLPGSHNPILGQQGIPNLISSSTSGGLPPPNNAITTPNLLDFTRRLSFAAQQRSQTSLTNRLKPEESSHPNSFGKQFREDLKKLQQSRRIDLDILQNNPDELVKLSRQLEEELHIVQSVMVSLAKKTGNENLMPCKLYSAKQLESRSKIESLQRELQECKRAQERERSRRKSLEKEQESLKSTLERMGGDLLSLVMSNSGPIEAVKSRKNSEKPLHPEEYGETDSITSTRRHSADDIQSTAVEKDKFQSKMEAGVDKCFRRVQSHSHPANYSDSSPAAILGPTAAYATKDEKKPSSDSSKRRSPNLDSKRSADDTQSEPQKGFPLDLTNPPPEKRLKGGSKFFGIPLNHSQHEIECTSNEDPFSIKEDLTKTSYAVESTVESHISSIHITKGPQTPQGGSSSPSYSSSSHQPEVQSPSTSSSCSSAEDSQRCPSSPTSRISPTLTLFRSKNSNSYPHYQSRVNGPIQVT